MPDPFKKEKYKDSRAKFDNDVDRMINEGMAGGTVGKNHHKAQIEEARNLPLDDEPFPDTTESRTDE